MEEWKPVTNYEGIYEVSSQGRVKSLKQNASRRKRILKPCAKNGYLSVNLFKDGACKHAYIHRLVAEAFINNPDNLKEVNHKDCDKTNNSVSNLEWCSRKQNLEHSYKNGLKRTGENHGGHKLTQEQVDEIRSSSLSQKELAKKFKVRQCTISAILRNKLWKEVVPNVRSKVISTSN